MSERYLLGDEPVDPSRSALMARVRGKNTKPEIVVRRTAHALGYRFRLHAKDLPGQPDMVFRSRKKVVFIHGCFWHRHRGCRKVSTPTTRRDFWEAKFARNVERDARKELELRAAGFDVLVIWECETKYPDAVADKLCDFLGPPGRVDGRQSRSPSGFLTGRVSGR